MFENSLYNTFDGGKVADVQAASKYLGCKPIRARLLSEILEEHDVAQIDFFTIDVEGHEIEVLRSNNWIKFRPKIIIVEWFCRQRNVLETSPLHKFLESQNYVFFCNTATNAIYLEREFLSVRFPDYV